MTKPQILSTSTRRPPAAGTLIFDACHAGVVLRAVLFVELVSGVALLFLAASPAEWLQQLAMLTGGVLPATLAWLLAACSLKRVLQAARVPLQVCAGVVLGALAGLLACALLAYVTGSSEPRWLASAASGALLSALLVAALVLRAHARAPAATTARLAELQARIRPHFLFNSLNSAIALVREEPAKAETLLEDLSELFRHALLEQGDSASLAEEVQLARHYLAIEQIRFGERMQLAWKLDERAGSARVPPLLLQPLVENAVKHGVEPSPLAALIEVRTQRRGARVLITITNSLPPRAHALGPAAPGHGIALNNVRARLKLLHDVECDFSAGAQGGRYQVRIGLPAV
ncbi:sensor histidine kinase [Comamonas sp. NLF-1-9]|uniref:sensor histidine kinase n=1 Tax=Comamonas sp. NLF-1-9 TaxID=2853163 RepID=UPI001C444E24|nr:histidine kinase [Comamonas sp. NLF-1-9]QXL84487.1 histidine kinase [Comamonas sp. NLF-1-9]